MQITSLIAIASAALGLVFLATSHDRKTGYSKFNLFCGMAMLFLVAPVAYCWDSIGADHGMILLALAAIVVGIALTILMIQLFSTTSPWSEDAGQFLFFGFCKWDNFAEWLIAGLFILGFGVYTLGSSTFKAWETKAAYDSIKKCERERAAEKLVEKPLAAASVKTAPKTAKQPHKHSKKAKVQKLAASH